MSLLGFMTGLATLRWQWLLQAQGVQAPFFQTLKVNLIGTFFNTALPGAVSGDFVKVFYIAQNAPGRRGQIFGSILFDRILGLSGLILVAAAALWGDWSLVRGTGALPAIRLTLALGAFGVLSFFSYLFWMPSSHDPIEKVLLRLVGWKPRAQGLANIYVGVRAYQNRKLAVLMGLSLSILIHLCVCWCCLQFAYALGEQGLSVSPVFLFVPLGLLVTAVPLLPGGIGTGHAAFSWGFHIIGSDRGADIFSLLFMTNLLIGIVGSIVYVSHRKKA